MARSDRDRALALAADIRRTRHTVQRDLATGELTLTRVLDRAADDPMVACIKVLSVVEALPEVGKVRARRVLDAAEIEESTPLGALREADRDQLIGVLGR